MTAKYVVFGYSSFLGDITDIIHSYGRCVSKIVLNIPEVTKPGRLTLAQMVGRLGYTADILTLEQWKPEPPEGYVIGFAGIKMEPLVQQLKKDHKIAFANLIHKTAIVPASAAIPESSGIIMNAGVIIGPYTKIGEHSILNRGSSTGHDSVIGDYVFLGPRVTVCGCVDIGKGAFIGAAATIVPDQKIGACAIVGAGSVVLEDVPERVMVAGVPAQIKKKLA